MRRSSARPFRRAAHQQHGPQRHDERHHLKSGDQQPVQGAAQRGGRDGAERRRATGPDAGAQQQRDDDRAQRDHRADRQIDPAGDDHHRHAERGDAHDDRLPRHQLEVGGTEELRADERAEDQGDDDEPDEHAALVEEPPRAYEAARAPDASINNECSVHSSTGRAGPSRPRDITAMRSQTPSSSGR